MPKIRGHGGPTNALPITPEDLGATVPQNLALVDFRSLWRTFIHDAGSASPSDATRRNLGGDFVDVMETSSTSRLWFGSDAWAGGTGTIVNGRYTQDLVPFRNWVAAETNGVLGGQIDHDGGAATTREWLDADSTPGEPAGYYWWANSGTKPDRNNVFGTPYIACTLLDAAQLVAPTFGAVASSIVTVGLFGTYSDHINVTWGPDANFWLHSLRHHPPSGKVYGTGLVIDYSQTVFPSTLAEYQAYGGATGRKLCRVADSQLMTEASWEFWTGDGWSGDPGEAIEMLSTEGVPAGGMTGNPVFLSDGAWLTVGRPNVVSPYLDVWRDDTLDDPGPTGPWRLLCRVPIPGVGLGLENGGTQASHHATIVPSIGVSRPGYSVAMCTSVAILHSTMVGLSTDCWTPQFVVVPHDMPAITDGMSELDTGSWAGFGELVRQSVREAEAEAQTGPVACPIDGEPLRRASDGGLFCPYDGWRPSQ